MSFKTFEDIERERHDKNRIKIRNEISEDINEIIGNVFVGSNKKQKTSFFIKITKIFLILLFVIILVNITLGNIWLLRFFLKSLFGINI